MTAAERKRALYAADPSKQREHSRRYRERIGVVYKQRRKEKYWRDAEGARRRSRAYYAANKARAAAQAREYRKHNADKRRMQKRCATYGITVADFREMWNMQAGRCAICLCRLVDDGSRHTHVDHDHATGAVRGLLCVDCNVALGRFKDNPDNIKRAAEYLGRLTPHSVLSNGRDGR